jgi:hypothetical protein
MPCSTVCVFHSANYLSSIFRSPNPARASFVRYLLYKMNKIGENCILVQLIFQSLYSLCLLGPISRIVTPWSTQNLLINLLSPQSLPVPRPALLWHSLHGQTFSTDLWSKYTLLHLCPKFVLALVPLLNPNWPFQIRPQTSLQAFY